MAHYDDYEDKKDRERAEAAYVKVDAGERLDRSTLTFLMHHWRGSTNLGLALGNGQTCFYRHEKSKEVYVAIGLCLREADLRPLVRYHPLGSPELELSRPMDEWDAKFVRVYANTVYDRVPR